MTDLRVAAEQARVALKELLNDTQHKDHDCGDEEWCPVLHAKRALASLEAALQAQPEQQQGQGLVHPDSNEAQVQGEEVPVTCVNGYQGFTRLLLSFTSKKLR